MPYALSVPAAILCCYIANAAYQGSLVARNAAEANADIGMAVCLVLMAIVFICSSAFIYHAKPTTPTTARS